MAAKPPLELHAIITKADGRSFRWDANDRRAENRPMGIECSSKLMEGFADASCELARRPGVYPDLGLYDDFRLEGLDGQVAYEGRGDSFPGDVSDDRQRVGVRAVGWMTHARDRPMPPIVYVDRDLARWQSMSAARRSALVAAAVSVNDGQADTDSSAARLVCAIPGNASTTRQVAEMLYVAEAGGYIGSIYYAFVRGTNVTASYEAYVFTDDADTWPSSTTTGNLCASASSAATHTAGAGERFGAVQLLTPSGDGGTDGLTHDVTFVVVVFGDQGLTKYGTAPDQGYLSSDMIADSGQRFAPLLDYSLVPATDFAVQQAVLDQVTDPYDFWLDLNRWELRHLAVWEGRKLTFEPFDYDAVDWRVRTDEPGVRVRHAGPSAARVANGVIVSYQDVSTLRSTIITPDDDERLRDDAPNIEANKHGIDAWETIQLPDPDSAEGAIRYGQKALERLNRQQAPTRITVKGHIRDDAGHWHQGWMPRAGQTVLPEDEEDGAPRMIHEARWNAAAKTMTLACDASSESIDAILDQLLTQAKMARSR